MRLTAKIIALFLVAAALLVAAGGYFSMQREVDLFQEEMARRHSDLALVWGIHIRNLLNLTGDEDITLAVKLTDNKQPMVRPRWVYRHADTPAGAEPYVDPQQLLDLTAGEIRSLPVKFDDKSERYCSYYVVGYSTADSCLLELSEPFTRRDAYTQGTFLNTIYVLICLGIVAVLTAGLVGVHLVGRPLDALVQKTKRAAQGDLEGPLHIEGKDELSQLATALNNMCSSLQNSRHELLTEVEKRSAAVEQLRHSDRLKTVGRLGAGIAHELGTPLNVVAGRAAMIANGRLNEDDTKRSAETIRSEANRMTKLIEGLLDFSRRTPSNRGECHVADVVNSTIPLLDSFARKRSAVITTEIADNLVDECHADCGQLQQVISNLVMNALLSKPERVAVTVKVANANACQPHADESHVQSCIVIEVTDDGDGIPADIKPHLFEPFFTTRDTGEGTGLGLSIAHGIVDEHGGWIEVDSEPGKGSTFAVYLPQKG